MNAKTQYKLTPDDLACLLAVHRGGTLAAAAERLRQDSSTVFRAITRIERGLSQSLFARTRRGYLATEAAEILLIHAEQLETTLEAARSAVQDSPQQVSGLVRITTTDTLLHALVAPELKPLHAQHPTLAFDIHLGNELANLSKRDADIAIRATRTPPEHLVAKHLGPLEFAVYVAEASPVQSWQEAAEGGLSWVGLDDALPGHSGVIWRRKHLGSAPPVFRVSSLLTATEFVALGLGLAVLPVFLAEPRGDLRRISQPLTECQNELWLITHPESRHLRRIATVAQHLAAQIQLTPLDA
jgi:DNA-binding transcriptional LysR family regulator